MALLAGFLFFRLPLAYHTPASIGLNYQLALVGLYGGCRVIDAFFVSLWGFDHVPRRVRYTHWTAPGRPVGVDTTEAEWELSAEKGNPVKGTDELELELSMTAAAEAPEMSSGKASKESSASSNERRGSLTQATVDTLARTLSGPRMRPVLETATSEDGWPHGFLDRASWALELELSMRGVGFTWTTADVRHTRRTWLPTVSDRAHSILVRVLPILMVCFVVIRGIYTRYLEEDDDGELKAGRNPFDEKLNLGQQVLLTAALGAFLMAAFSLAHSMFAIMLSPLAPSPLAFFPPLYTTRIWDIVSIRGFWSYGWHRLFARLFLVYGVWPGEFLERKILGKRPNQRADVGKVLGGFLSSAFVHSFAVRSVLGGDWTKATGEAKFFAVNGFAVVLEEGIKRVIREWRRRKALPREMWYDVPIGRLWWIMVLLLSGRQFARGWVNAGLVREMAAR